MRVAEFLRAETLVFRTIPVPFGDDMQSPYPREPKHGTILSPVGTGIEGGDNAVACLIQLS